MLRYVNVVYLRGKTVLQILMCVFLVLVGVRSANHRDRLSDRWWLVFLAGKGKLELNKSFSDSKLGGPVKTIQPK